MLLFSTLGNYMPSDLIINYINLIDLKFWIIFCWDIIILGLIIWLASRTTDKILKGLQGVAATTIIGKAIRDEIKSSQNSDDNNSKRDDDKSKIKEENKTEESSKNENE